MKFSQFMNENDKDYKDTLKYESQYIKEKQDHDESKFQMSKM